MQVAQDVADLIKEEHAKCNQVIVSVSGGRKTQAIGALFEAYARNNMVQRIVHAASVK